MNIVDSCGWLEYFADGKNAHIFAPIIENTTELLVPVISIYEVFKRVLQQRDESAALQTIALMQQGQIIPLSVETSLLAAKLSVDYRLPMADSLILATARQHHARLWTQDVDFAHISDVQFFPKPPLNS